MHLLCDRVTYMRQLLAVVYEWSIGRRVHANLWTVNVSVAILRAWRHRPLMCVSRLAATFTTHKCFAARSL